MSAQPVNPPPPDHVHDRDRRRRDDRDRKGSMIIQAADKAGIPIPRFCYHDKLRDRGQLPHVPGRGREDAASRRPPAPRR